MDISEMSKLKTRLAVGLSSMLLEFEVATGVRVSGINLDHIDVTRMGDPDRRYMPAITVEVQL